MKKTGFTLMEAMLAVVVIAIIAAASIPHFSNGAAEAFEESRKSAFLAAYENTVAGANAMMSAATVCGGDNWLDGWNLDQHPIENFTVSDEKRRILHDFAPISTRMFKNNKGVDFYLSATVGPNHTVLVVCKDSLFGDKIGDKRSTNKDGYPIVVNKDLLASLDAFWNVVKDMDKGVIESKRMSEWNKVPIKWNS